jgi:predicted dehydrogenase
MKPLKVGIIGLGVGEKHIKAYQNHPMCEVVFLCDFADNKIAEATQKYPGIRVTKNANEVIEDPAVDVISIASFDDYHFTQVKNAVNNGKHIFIEKPLCLHREEAVQIRNLLNKNPHIKLSSNLNLRTCPLFQQVKQFVQSDELGEIYYMEADYLWGRLYKLTDGWRKNMDFYSIIHGAAVHMIDLILWLSGMKPVEIQGYGNQIASQESGFLFNDFAAILMKFENGMVAKVSANGGCVHPHFHKLSIYGTNKTFMHDIEGANIVETVESHPVFHKINKDYPGNEKDKIISSFVDSVVDTKAKAINNADDVFNTMSVCFAAEDAVQKGQPIKITYL